MEKETQHNNSIFKVRRYISEDCNIWNQFVSNSKNATFLFHRDFMEYHKHKFDDFSLLVFKNEKLVALLPANRIEDTIYSHQGISYGGFLISNTIRFEGYIAAFKALLIFLENENIETFHFKKMPSIYHKNLSKEIDYVLSALEAKQHTFDSYFVIDDLSSYKPNRNRKRAIQLSEHKNVAISHDGLDVFWEQILQKNLTSRFNVNPVHSITEIHYLMQKFPEQIKFYSAKKDNKILAGVVMFITDNVAHFQYSSGNEERTESGALDALFNYIIKKYSHKKYISFGSSSTDKSLKIDKGLAYWKESFGASIIKQESYIINPKNHFKLNLLFK